MAYEAADDVTNVEWDDVPSRSRRLYDIAHSQSVEAKINRDDETGMVRRQISVIFLEESA